MGGKTRERSARKDLVDTTKAKMGRKTLVLDMRMFSTRGRGSDGTGDIGMADQDIATGGSNASAKSEKRE